MTHKTKWTLYHWCRQMQDRIHFCQESWANCVCADQFRVHFFSPPWKLFTVPNTCLQISAFSKFPLECSHLLKSKCSNLPPRTRSFVTEDHGKYSITTSPLPGKWILPKWGLQNTELSWNLMMNQSIPVSISTQNIWTQSHFCGCKSCHTVNSY